MLRTLAAVIALGAALEASALPAGASSAQTTAIESFASSVTTVAYQQPVTFTGELVAVTGLNSTTPVQGEPVQIQINPTCEGTFAPVATGTTGAGGQFAITTTLPSGGCARAMFGGDTGLAPSSSPARGTIVGVTHVPSRLVLDPVPRSVPAGTQVTFSGTMQVQVNGTWRPFEGAPLTLTMEPYTSTQPNAAYATTSGPDGRFSLTESLSETSSWSVDTSLDGSYWESWFPDYARASYNWIDGVSKTRVTGFSLPAKEEAHYAWANGLYATGTVERWNGISWVGLAYGSVRLCHRPKGYTRWHCDSGGQIGASGKFRIMVSIYLGATCWRARVVPAADTLTSTSTTVTSRITDATHFASASIQRTSSGSLVYGRVTDWRSGQPSFSSLRGLKLILYDRADGTTTWHAYKTGKVQANGFFQFSVARSHGYQFKVVLPDQGPFLSSTSRVL